MQASFRISAKRHNFLLKKYRINTIDIPDPAFHTYLFKKEAHKTSLEGKRSGKQLRQPQEPPRTRNQQNIPSDVDGTLMNEDNDALIIYIGDDETDDDINETSNVVPANEEGNPDEPTFEINPDMEVLEKKLL